MLRRLFWRLERKIGGGEPVDGVARFARSRRRLRTSRAGVRRVRFDGSRIPFRAARYGFVAAYDAGRQTEGVIDKVRRLPSTRQFLRLDVPPRQTWSNEGRIRGMHRPGRHLARTPCGALRLDREPSVVADGIRAVYAVGKEAGPSGRGRLFRVTVCPGCSGLPLDTSDPSDER